MHWLIAYLDIGWILHIHDILIFGAKIQNYFRFNFVYFSYYCDSLPEYAQFHKQLQKQFHDKYVLKIHHVWQLSFFENPI